MDCPKHPDKAMVRTVVEKDGKREYARYMCFECGFIYKDWEVRK